jgi:hypothetical protein
MGPDWLQVSRLAQADEGHVTPAIWTTMASIPLRLTFPIEHPLDQNSLKYGFANEVPLQLLKLRLIHLNSRTSSGGNYVGTT